MIMMMMMKMMTMSHFCYNIRSLVLVGPLHFRVEEEVLAMYIEEAGICSSFVYGLSPLPSFYLLLLSSLCSLFSPDSLLCVSCFHYYSIFVVVGAAYVHEQLGRSNEEAHRSLIDCTPLVAEHSIVEFAF